jgi:hypothetical protein
MYSHSITSPPARAYRQTLPLSTRIILLCAYASLFLICFRILRIDRPFFAAYDATILTGLLTLLVTRGIPTVPWLRSTVGQLWVAGTTLLVSAITVSGIYHTVTPTGLVYTAQAAVCLLAIPILLSGHADVRIRVDQLINWTLMGMIASSVLTIAFFITGTFSDTVATPADRFQGFSENANAYARLMAIGSILAIYRLLSAPTKQKPFWAAGLLAILAALGGTAAFGGFIAAFGGLVVFLYLAGLRRTVFALITLALGCALALWHIPMLGAFDRRVRAFLETGDLTMAGSATGRIASSQSELDQLNGLTLLIGHGPLERSSHIGYVQLLLDGGALALLGFSAIALCCILVLRNGRVRDRLLHSSSSGVVIGSFIGLGTASSLFVREWWLLIILGLAMNSYSKHSLNAPKS